MKVRDLLKLLSNANPESDVVVIRSIGATPQDIFDVMRNIDGAGPVYLAAGIKPGTPGRKKK